METVITKEINISNLDELFTVVTEALNKCNNTQIFISNLLISRLLKENKDNIVWEEAIVDGFYYCDTIEKAFIFSIKNNNEKKPFQMNFVEYCSDYYHLTFFASKGILYHPNLIGMETILIINSD